MTVLPNNIPTKTSDSSQSSKRQENAISKNTLFQD